MDPYHDTHRFVNHKMRYVSTFLLSTWTQYTYRIVCPRSTHTQGFICFAYALALGAPPAAMPLWYLCSSLYKTTVQWVTTATEISVSNIQKCDTNTAIQSLTVLIELYVMVCTTSW